jgi:transcriptional regulator with XRE-family HTH domain
MSLQQIGERIRYARERAGLTQEELAKRIGKSQKAVSGYEKGQRAIRIDELPTLAEALGVAPGYFFGFGDVSADLSTQLAFAKLTPPFKRMSANILSQFSVIQDHFLQQNKDLKELIAANAGVPWSETGTVPKLQRNAAIATYWEIAVAGSNSLFEVGCVAKVAVAKRFSPLSDLLKYPFESLEKGTFGDEEDLGPPFEE